jgi:biotin carboxyl carrier protein
MRYLATVGVEQFSVEVARRGSGRYTVRLNGVERMVETRAAGGSTILSMDGHAFEALVTRQGDAPGTASKRFFDVAIAGRHYEVGLADPLRQGSAAKGAQAHGSIEVRSAMPGKIVAVLVEEGARVRAGQGLVVVEAMKMENEIAAPRDGRVARLRVATGEAVEAGALLVSLE